MDYRNWKKYVEENKIKVEAEARFEASTKTAVQAAEQLGCEVDQIGKSIVFKNGEEAAIFIIRGSKRLNTDKAAEELGLALTKADADWVKEKTGYTIGGVPPFGHLNKCAIYMDRGLTEFDEVWSASGDGNSVFKIKTEELIKFTSPTLTASAE